MSARVYAGFLYAVLALFVLHFSLIPHGNASLVLTLRHQFNRWDDLISLYRNTSSYAPLSSNGTRVPVPIGDALWYGESMRDSLLRAAWCEEYLPPGAQRAPFCGCLSRSHDSYLNASSSSVSQGRAIPTAVRDSAVRGLVSCLGFRPVWRVWPFWSVHIASPCVYVFVVAASFLWMSSDMPDATTSRLVWALCVYTSAFLVYAGVFQHVVWCASILTVGALAQWVILPGLCPQEDAGGAPNAPGDRTPMPRQPSCFWWAEYLCAPVFALYAGAVHGGRDAVFACVVVVLGAAVGGLGMRSFWCGYAYSDGGAKAQLRPVLQRVVWFGIFSASAALLSLVSVYYQPDLPVRLGAGSVILLGATVLVSLLQYPGTESWSALPVQAVIVCVRSLALLYMVYYDAAAVDQQ